MLLLLFAIGLCTAAPADEHQLDSRIVGGQEAAPGTYPYIVSLRTLTNVHFCAGAILNNNTIVTAAHCISGRPPSSIRVISGTMLLSTGGLISDVKFTVVHPDYDGTDLANDVGLLTLDSEIVYDTLTQPIALQNNTILGGLPVVFTGWGSTAYPGNPSNTLQFLEVVTISVEDCVSRFDDLGTIYDTSLCTFTRIGEGACNGDSGSPLIYGNTLIGILSWGSPCARGYPDVFTRLSEYVDWIYENIDM